jgi:hypothetical protein
VFVPVQAFLCFSLKHLMKFHVILCNFVHFYNISLSLLTFSKVLNKILVSFGLFQISEILDLAMAKDKKVNIAVT